MNCKMKTIVTLASVSSFEAFLAKCPKICVVVHADWCPHCQRYIPLLDDAEPPVHLYLIEEEVYKKLTTDLLAVKGYPTTFILEKGAVLKKQAGELTVRQLMEMCD